MQIASVPFLNLCTKAFYNHLCRIHIHYDIWIYFLFYLNFFGKKINIKLKWSLLQIFCIPSAFYPPKFEDLDKYCNSKFHNLVNTFYKLEGFNKKKDLIENQ